MPAFEVIAERKTELIRKALGGIIAVAPQSVALPAALTTGAAADLNALPTGYSQLGWVTKGDGITFATETETSDVESWGALEPTRSDIISDSTSAQFTCQETNRAVLEMRNNLDLSAVVPDATTGEITFNKVSVPQTIYRRMIFLAYDGPPAGRIYIAKIMPRANLTEAGDETWNSESELSYPLTVSAKLDSTAGFAVRIVFGGPGWQALLSETGFAA